MNISLCRVCGGEENLKHINTDEKDLIEKLFTCANIAIKEDDVLPKYICIGCEQGLEFSYNLRKRGEATEKKLRQSLVTSVQVYNVEENLQVVDSTTGEISDNEGLIKHKSIEYKIESSENEATLYTKHKRKEKIEANPYEELKEEQFDRESNSSEEVLNEVSQDVLNEDMRTLSGENDDKYLDDYFKIEIEKPNVETQDFEKKNERNTEQKVTELTSYNILAEVVISDDDGDDAEQIFKGEDSGQTNVNEQIENDNNSEYNGEIENDNEEEIMDCNENSEDYYFLDDIDYKETDEEKCETEGESITDDDDDDNDEEFQDEIVAPESDEPTLQDTCSFEIVPDSVVVTDILIQDDAQNAKKNVAYYNCVTCHEEFTTQAAYRKHIKMHGSKRYQCIQCNRWFPTRYRLQSHELYHTENGQMVDCPHCHRTYRSTSNLRRHIRTAHTDVLQYTCDLCGMRFSRIDVLKAHMVKHQTDRNFGCTLCPRRFKCKNYLVSHMKTHAEKYRKIAPKDTATVVELDSESNPYPTTAEKIKTSKEKKTYMCLYCGKNSTRLEVHKNHLRTHTKEQPFACETCEKRFRTMAALITHERLHTDLRPYQCELCLVSFRQSAHLKEHKLVHTGVMPHVCKFCGTAFRKKGNLTVHMRAKHHSTNVSATVRHSTENNTAAADAELNIEVDVVEAGNFFGQNSNSNDENIIDKSMDNLEKVCTNISPMPQVFGSESNINMPLTVICGNVVDDGVIDYENFYAIDDI